MTYNVFGGTLSLTQSIDQRRHYTRFYRKMVLFGLDVFFSPVRSQHKGMFLQELRQFSRFFAE